MSAELSREQWLCRPFQGAGGAAVGPIYSRGEARPSEHVGAGGFHAAPYEFTTAGIFEAQVLIGGCLLLGPFDSPRLDRRQASQPSCAAVQPAEGGTRQGEVSLAGAPHWGGES